MPSDAPATESPPAVHGTGSAATLRPFQERALWLLVIVGDCAPETSGPFGDDAERLRAARAYRAREGDEDGLFRLDVDATGRPSVEAFGGGELDACEGEVAG